MPDDPPTPISILVKLKVQPKKPPTFTFTHPDGKPANPLKVPASSIITFTQAPGSDDFYFKDIVIRSTQFQGCPPSEKSSGNPTEFSPFTLSPSDTAATSLILPDQESDTSLTKYYYAMQVVSRTDSAQDYWSDPEIENHSGNMPEPLTVRRPDDMPPMDRGVDRMPSGTETGAPPPT
jgi:hypothetical protein